MKDLSTYQALLICDDSLEAQVIFKLLIDNEVWGGELSFAMQLADDYCKKNGLI